MVKKSVKKIGLLAPFGCFGYFVRFDIIIRENL